MRPFISFPLLLFFISGYSQFIVPEERFMKMFQDGKYDDVYREALKLRGDVYGKNALLDYFIAKSLCLKGEQDAAIREYYNIKKNYCLSPKQKRFLQSEFSSCSTPDPSELQSVLSVSNFNYLNSFQSPVGGVAGKMGMVFNCYSQLMYTHLDSLVSKPELRSRLFGLSEKKKAYESLKNRLGDEYTIDSSGRFMLVTLRSYSMNNIQIKSTADQLEKTFHFYTDYYDLRLPDKLITVYLMPGPAELRAIAKKIHHLDLPYNQLGYSCLADLSLLGIADPAQLATLFHELFHIVVRTDIGDIPAWLDEGLASLYTISHWENNILVGNNKPWRWNELQKASQSRDPSMQVPNLTKLVEYNWDEFNGIEDSLFNLCRAAINYAYSNFLMIYLQHQGQLRLLVNAYKNRPKGSKDTVTGSAENKLILELALGIDIDSLRQAYNSWLYSFEGIRIQETGNESMFSSFGNLLEKCHTSFYVLYEYLHSDDIRNSETQLRQLESDYNANRSLYESQVQKINDQLKSSTQTFLQETGGDTDYDRAVVYYNKIISLEVTMRKILFEHRNH
ncbi:MAG TPA: hypothetical protein VMH01_02665 [Puia sp.]|nr:hypothetical protein [Puia sp.]